MKASKLPAKEERKKSSKSPLEGQRKSCKKNMKPTIFLFDISTVHLHKVTTAFAAKKMTTMQ